MPLHSVTPSAPLQPLVSSRLPRIAATAAAPHVQEITVDVLINATKIAVAKRENLEHHLKRITHLMLNGNDKRVFSRMQNLQLCPHLKVLYLYDNHIERMENLDHAKELTQLHLQNNRISKIENLQNAIHLEKIYLENNSITRLEGLAECLQLREIHLSNQKMPRDVAFSFEFESLRSLVAPLCVLNLSNCQLTSTTELMVLKNLQELDVSHNRIVEIEQILQLVRNLSSLRELDVRDNVVCSVHRFREQVIVVSGCAFEMLDKKDIDANQRRMMQRHAAHKHKVHMEHLLKKHQKQGVDTNGNGVKDADGEHRAGQHDFVMSSNQFESSSLPTVVGATTKNSAVTSQLPMLPSLPAASQWPNRLHKSSSKRSGSINHSLADEREYQSLQSIQATVARTSALNIAGSSIVVNSSHSSRSTKQ